MNPLQYILPIIGGAISSIIVYYYIEVRHRRKFETYVRIEGEYKSQENEKVTSMVLEVMSILNQKREELIANNIQNIDEQLISFYKSNFENSTDKRRKEDALVVRKRNRFYNLCGLFI